MDGQTTIRPHRSGPHAKKRKWQDHSRCPLCNSAISLHRSLNAHILEEFQKDNKQILAEDKYLFSSLQLCPTTSFAKRRQTTMARISRLSKKCNQLCRHSYFPTGSHENLYAKLAYIARPPTYANSKDMSGSQQSTATNTQAII
jgi:hypothetical protein